MPDRAVDPRSNRGFNVALVVLGAALGIGAVCLIVFGTTSPRHLLVGIIAGLWAALLAAFGLQGLRRPAAEHVVATEDLDALQAELSALADTALKATETGLKATQDSITSQGQDFRRMTELQAARDTAARREADLSLQLAIRHEIERSVADQVGSLREEVSSLRAEVVDRLDGQIKLERIEITRVIGSDLEALQNEVRRLASQREAAVPAGGFGTQASAHPASNGQRSDYGASDASPAAQPVLDDIVEAEVIEPRQAAEAATSETAAFSQTWGPVRAVRAKATPAPESSDSVSESRSVGSSLGLPASTSRSYGSPSYGSPSLDSSPFEPGPSDPRPAPWDPTPWEPSPFEPPAPQPSTPKPLPDPEPLPPLEPAPPANNGRRYPSGADIFADLPRLTPISPELLGPSGRRRAPEDDPNSPRYVGRRRPGDSPVEDREPAENARPPAAEPEPRPSDPRGRRRAPGHASD